MSVSAFADEDQMQQVLAQAVPRQFVDELDCCLVRREVPWGRKIVDVVIAIFPTPSAWNAVPPSLATVDTLQVFLLAAIASRRKASPQLLSRLLRKDAADLQAYGVEPLLSSGLIAETGRSCYELAGWHVALPDELIAVEAKLGRWRDAVKQAAAHIASAEYAYVAVPPSTAKVAMRKFGAVAASGVGLLQVDCKAQVRLVVDAQRQPKRRYDLNHWVRKIDLCRETARKS